jgi:hypothetical protein
VADPRVEAASGEFAVTAGCFEGHQTQDVGFDPAGGGAAQAPRRAGAGGTDGPHGRSGKATQGVAAAQSGDGIGGAGCGCSRQERAPALPGGNVG